MFVITNHKWQKQHQTTGLVNAKNFPNNCRRIWNRTLDDSAHVRIYRTVRAYSHRISCLLKTSEEALSWSWAYEFHSMHDMNRSVRPDTTKHIIMYCEERCAVCMNSRHTQSHTVSLCDCAKCDCATLYPAADNCCFRDSRFNYYCHDCKWWVYLLLQLHYARILICVGRITEVLKTTILVYLCIRYRDWDCRSQWSDSNMPHFCAQR